MGGNGRLVSNFLWYCGCFGHWNGWRLASNHQLIPTITMAGTFRCYHHEQSHHNQQPGWYHHQLGFGAASLSVPPRHSHFNTGRSRTNHLCLIRQHSSTLTTPPWLHFYGFTSHLPLSHSLHSSTHPSLLSYYKLPSCPTKRDGGRFLSPLGLVRLTAEVEILSELIRWQMPLPTLVPRTQWPTNGPSLPTRHYLYPPYPSTHPLRFPKSGFRSNTPAPNPSQGTPPCLLNCTRRRNSNLRSSRLDVACVLLSTAPWRIYSIWEGTTPFYAGRRTAPARYPTD
jgi:hypothetical protein